MPRPEKTVVLDVKLGLKLMFDWVCRLQPVLGWRVSLELKCNDVDHGQT